MVGAVIQPADKAKGDQQDMPCIGMDRQREISIVHAAGVKENLKIPPLSPKSMRKLWSLELIWQ